MIVSHSLTSAAVSVIRHCCFVCSQDIKAGTVVLHLPLRLAITDHTEDKTSNDLVYEDAPWSLRLACKLLREKARGSSSPWHPYLQA